MKTCGMLHACDKESRNYERKRRSAMEETSNEKNYPDWDRVTISQERYRLLRDDFYFVEVVGRKAGQGRFGPVFILFFKVLDEGRFHDCVIQDLINQTQTAKKGKLWHLFKAISGRELDVSDEFKLSDLIGKRCYIRVEKRGKNNAITEYVSERDFADIKRSRQ